jgi:signal transduction histidine kinase
MDSIPIAPWLRRVVREHEKLARARGIELSLTEPTEVLMVKGVPAQLDVVLEHLLANAFKFTDPGGHVVVSAALMEGMVRVTVTDTGIGFDPADANRMLDCFARAINAEAAKIPGIGVGLFLAGEVVKNHSGRLWLETRRDEGTQAHLALQPMAADVAL